jgi:hypothetical protein
MSAECFATSLVKLYFAIFKAHYPSSLTVAPESAPWKYKWIDLAVHSPADSRLADGRAQPSMGRGGSLASDPVSRTGKAGLNFSLTCGGVKDHRSPDKSTADGSASTVPATGPVNGTEGQR